MPSVLYNIGIYAKEQAESIASIVKEKVREAYDNPSAEELILLNRVRFAEVLMLTIETQEVKHRERLGGMALEEELTIHQEVNPLFDRFIIPLITEKEDDQIATSLNAFRQEYVWKEPINALLEHNLEGIMEVFTKFSEGHSFTMDSAEKLLKGIGSLIPRRVIKQQFDLAQMTVIDEETSSAEYDDMELVEFLEFLVRIAFVKNIDDQSESISTKLADLLREIIGLTQQPYIEPPKRHSMQSQASENDMDQFKDYFRKRTAVIE